LFVPGDDPMLEIAPLTLDLVDLPELGRRCLELAGHFEELAAPGVELRDLGPSRRDVFGVCDRKFLSRRLDCGSYERRRLKILGDGLNDRPVYPLRQKAAASLAQLGAVEPRSRRAVAV